MLRVTLFLALAKSVIGSEAIKIANESEFTSFVESVNGGTNYLGTTVLLDSDLSLSEETIEPIGNYNKYFLGVFDGRGHVISDFKVNSSSSEYAGLFGFSRGLTIRNVILDSSCSITSSFNGSSNAYTGGIIGYCHPSNRQCNFENSVNMADVAFSGNISNNCYLTLSGIAGYLYSYSPSSYDSYVKNCANYGSVTDLGTNGYSYIGGIVGSLNDANRHCKYIYNCLNYGKITHNGKTSYLRLGGIAGESSYTYLENCVSAGEISSTTTTSSSYIGSIVGLADSYTYIKYCYWASDVRVSDSYVTESFAKYPYTFSYDNSTFELNEAVSVGNYTGTSLIDALNAAADYYILRDYSKWLFNEKEKTVFFTISNRTSPITMDSQIILLPSLASEGSTFFDGWYNDAECAHPLDSFEATESKTLYGKFEENINNYTITFETRREDVSAAPITAQFGAVVSLPNDLTREYCSVAFWENEYGDNVGPSVTVPARNFTLYSVWKCTRIATPDDFVDFSKVVNSDSTYKGNTVYIDSDLSLFGKSFKPIYYFLGTFDGQGHIISDLKMNISSSRYTGLFGFSRGLTIRNVVLDSSCSITSSFGGSSNAYTGGIIGYCHPSNRQCNFENSVNMADVTFSGSISNNCYLTLSGIAGYLYSYSSSSYDSYVKNCANYGSVTDLGTNGYSYIGGIVGSLNDANRHCKYIYNCLNYGKITHNGKTSYLRLGGIAGESSYAYLENCVSAGEISSSTTTSYSYIGSIIGRIYSNTSINNSYWTSDVRVNELYGAGKPENTEGAPSSSTTTDLGKIKTYLNIYALDKGLNKWLLNEKNAPVSFIVNYGKGFILKSKIILFPNLVDNSENSFSGWYKSPFCNELFQEPSVTETTSLYGLYGLIFSVTFDANGGSATEKSKNVSYKSPYGELPEANRTGYMFLGWFTEKNEKVTNETIVANSYNHTLYAHWEEGNESNLILIVGVTAAAVIVIIVVIIIVLFIVLKKKDGNGNNRIGKKRPKDIELNNQPRGEYCRIVTAIMEEKEIKVASESSKSILTNLYHQGYTRPLMRDALFEAGIVEQTDYICEVCGNAAQKASENGKPKKFTEDDAAAIAMYTYDFGPDDFERNPYRIINKSLVGRNYKNLQKASGLLYLVMTALRKLPRYDGKTLYRGVRGDVNSDEGHYHNGNIIIWSALSSTSPSIEAIKTFLAKGSKSGKAEGTLFIIEGGWGYNIQPYSLFPDEEEILLEPERQFKVTGVISAEGLTIINLQMLDTPLSIPEIFGGK